MRNVIQGLLIDAKLDELQLWREQTDDLSYILLDLRQRLICQLRIS
jgi:hypothetical protein